MFKDKYFLKIGLQIGLVCFVFLAGFKLYLSAMDFNPYFDKSLVQFAIMPIILVLGGLFYRLAFPSYPFDFVKAIKFFLAATVVFVFVQLAFDFIYLTANESILVDFIEKSIAILNETKEEITKFSGNNAYADTLKNLQKTSVSDIALSEFIKKLFTGVILSFILAILLRK